MDEYLLRVAAWLSQGFNCIFLGGSHDQTVSARAYQNRHTPGWCIAYEVLNTIFFWQEDHCRDSYQAGVRFAKEVMAYKVE